MNPLVKAILTKKLDVANELVKEAFTDISLRKLVETKKMVAAKMFLEMDLSREKPAHSSIEDRRGQPVNAMAGQHWISSKPGPRKTVTPQEADRINASQNNTVVRKSPQWSREDRDSQPALEEEQLDEARFKIVRARIRGGKVQRRRKVSTVKGMTFRGGKLIRMSPAERRRRKMGARRAKIKVKSKRSRMLLKRKRSMNKRKAMGIR